MNCWEQVKGLGLQIQSCNSSRTQGSERVSKRTPREIPVWSMQRKPEASNQTNDSLQCTLAAKDAWASLLFLLLNVLELHRQRAEARGQGDGQDKERCMTEIHRESRRSLCAS